MARECRAVVSGVRPHSLAAQLGLRAGDCLLSVNGAPLRDQIDYRFAIADERVSIEAVQDGRVATLQVEKEPDEDLGLDFAETTFDGVRRCRNRCLFCFVDRLPKGLRQSMYVKDDDYRYSFLHGSYVTLTNLREEDWQRIFAQRLSPLYVSVHATNLDTRRRLLRIKDAPDVVEQIRSLGEHRIHVHAQIVLCPGVNDGEDLDRTIADLASLHENVISAAVVPVGLTRFGPPDGPRRFTVDELRATLRQVRGWQRRLRPRLGRSFVYLADEYYLATGSDLPGKRLYDGFPQYQNGVGLARVLLDEWLQVRRRLPRAGDRPPTVSLVTGELATPLLGPIVDELNANAGAKLTLYTARNEFFGHAVNVAGLLTASDLFAALAGLPLGDLLVLPRAMFDAEGLRTLDDYSASQVGEKLNVPVLVLSSIRDLARVATNPLEQLNAGATVR